MKYNKLINGFIAIAITCTPCILTANVTGESVQLTPLTDPPVGLSISSYSGMKSWFFWDPGTHAFRVGRFHFNQVDLATAGHYSFAYGGGRVLGDYSSAFGKGYVSGNYSAAFGGGNSVHANNSYGFGDEITIYSDFSYSGGEWTAVYHDSPFSFAHGMGSYIQNSIHSVSFGQLNEHYNSDYSLTAGKQNYIGAYPHEGDPHGTAIGAFNHVSAPHGTAVGAMNEVDALHATAIGYGLNVETPYAFVIGKYNSDTGPSGSGSGPVFAIGDGVDGNNRSNLFAIYDDNGESTVHADYYVGNGSGLSGLGGGLIHSSGGNLGIGTSTPSATLDVDGTTHVSGNGLTIGGANIENAWLRVGDNLGMDNNEIQFAGTHGNIGTIGNNDLVFLTNGSTRMTIKSNGNIRIGTGNPNSGYKLDVGGNLQVDGTLDVQTNLAVGANVGIGTTSPSAKLSLQNGAFLAAGTVGVTPVSGVGTRLMWIPEKFAFRAGMLVNDPPDYETGIYNWDGSDGTAYWDSSNIGLGSFTTGVNTQASGSGSVAVGIGTYAYAKSSTAGGFRTTASGTNSVAFGAYSTASGQTSTAIGNMTTASGNRSLASGSGTEAAGHQSSAHGLNTESYHNDSFVVGRYNDRMDEIASDAADRPLFVVGNGSNGGNRDNAFVVKADGTILIQPQGDIPMGIYE